MSDEAVLIVALLGGIALLCAALLRRQWGKERRLAALTEIAIPIQSLTRTVMVVVPAAVAGPVLVGVFAAVTDPLVRAHALAATLTGIGLGLAGTLAGWRVSRRYCRVGLLRYTPARLELQLGDRTRHIDLDQPYELQEGLGWGPANMPLQVLYVRQRDTRWGFSYGLPLGRKPYGETPFDRYVEPLVDAEARVIHDKLRRK